MLTAEAKDRILSNDDERRRLSDVHMVFRPEEEARLKDAFTFAGDNNMKAARCFTFELKYDDFLRLNPGKHKEINKLIN